MVAPLITAVCLTRSPQRADMLAEALHSYWLQTYQRRELIVVNDGEPLAPAAAGVTVVNLPTHASIGAKRNAGTAAARGDLVAPWDDDDFSMPERLELQSEQLFRERAVSVRSSLMWLATSDLNVKGLISGECYATALMRRDAVDRVGGYPEISYREDMELHLRMRLRKSLENDLLTPGFFYVCRRHTMNVSNPYEKDNHFKRMLPSPDVGKINSRLTALRALPRGILVTPLHGPSIPVPERVPAPAGWAGR